MDEHRDNDSRDSADTIDLTDDYQVRQWIEILDISAAHLARAVCFVGPKAADVKRYIRKTKR